jgi:predicted nucleic acid-binding protein
MLIDSSVWLEVFLKGPLSQTCKKLIQPSAKISCISYFEVYKKLKLHFSEQLALEALGGLGSYEQIALTSEIALLAADLAIEHKLAMTDSFILAQANHAKITLVTLDNDFSGLPGAQVIR